MCMRVRRVTERSVTFLVIAYGNIPIGLRAWRETLAVRRKSIAVSIGPVSRWRVTAKKN